MARNTSAALTAIIAATGAASAQVFQDGQDEFEGGVSAAGWSWRPGAGVVEPAGGNCAGFLHDAGFVAAVPTLRTAAGGLYSGLVPNFSGLEIQIDLDIRSGPSGGRPLAVMLVNDNSTPADPSDDWGAYTLGPTLHPPGQGWRRHRFGVLLPGLDPLAWTLVRLGPAAPTPTLAALMAHTDRAGFAIGDPGGAQTPAAWDIGVDNTRVVYSGEFLCFANCDQSVTPPILNISDFICFMSLYATGDTRANCDYSTACPFLNISDFICFQTMYAAGCR